MYLGKRFGVAELRCPARSTRGAGWRAPGMPTVESFMGRASAPHSARAEVHVKRGDRGQQWYARPAARLSCWQTLKPQHDWGRYWYATLERIPYERAGERREATKLW